MKMELSAFRRIYKRRLIVTLLVAITYLITSLISLGLAAAGARTLPMIGLTGSTLMCSLFILRRQANWGVLRDEELLQKAYLEETDERNVAVCAKAGQPVVRWLCVGLLMGGCLMLALCGMTDLVRDVKLMLCGAGAALYLAGLAQMLVSWVLKKYWEKRM